MSFSDFHGNATTVHSAREMLARGRFPHAIILSGPRGSGKFTLAQMLAKAMNCLERPLSADGLPDYCGRCSNCERIGQADDLDARVAEAVEAREALRETDKKETRILIQTHPDVLIIPPDPPQLRCWRSAWLATSARFIASMTAAASLPDVPAICWMRRNSASAASINCVTLASMSVAPSKMSPSYSRMSVSYAMTCCMRSAHC